jgi:tRNA(adenine34) deaminase
MEDIFFTDEYFMKQALIEAQKAFDMGEVPVGCVVVSNNQIIGKGHNLTEQLNDVTAHAEMQAITAAANYLGAKYLNDCTIYISLEPCVMCAGAIFWAQFERVVFAAKDEKRGFEKAMVKLHPKTKIHSGILANEAAELMKLFFKNLR